MRILGLNKYSHSASCVLLDESGEVLFALAKERVTRKKFDGGDVAGLVGYSLERTGLSLDDVGLVVENCHLFRIDQFEPRLPFAVGVHYYPQSYLDELNLTGDGEKPQKVEIPHHLAHAYGCMLTAPFDEGIILVMDGMGSARSDMAKSGRRYFPESKIERHAGFTECPEHFDVGVDWREAETAYLFRGNRIQLLFKRWTPLRSPSLCAKPTIDPRSGNLRASTTGWPLARWYARSSTPGAPHSCQPSSRPTLT